MQMHYHPEYELHLLIKGEGVRFIGDNISHFSAGEVILLGENLPHGWHCKEEYFQDNEKAELETIVIHFSPNFLYPLEAARPAIKFCVLVSRIIDIIHAR